MYCVYQLDNQSVEKIIGYINSEDKFLLLVTKYIMTMHPTYKLVESIPLETIKNNNTDYSEAIYVLNNQNTIQLVQKTKTISEGYVYNSVYYDSKVLYTWKLLPFDDLLTKTCGTEYNICKFDFEDIKGVPKFLVSAKSGSGKIHLVANMLHYLNQRDDFIENSLIISPTDRSTRFYSSYFPRAKIIYQYEENIVKEHLANGKGCIVFDDCFSSRAILNFPKDFANSTIPLIVTCQTSCWIGTELESMVDYTFVFKEFQMIRNKLWANYQHIFPAQASFEKVFEECIKDSGVMVIDNKNSSNDVEKKICWYKATLANKLI